MQAPTGALLGYWRAEGLSAPQGVTTDGTDVWVVDAGSKQVLRYAGAAALTSGMAVAASKFPLAAACGLASAIYGHSPRRDDAMSVGLRLVGSSSARGPSWRP